MNKFMRLMVFFDLPVVKDKDRKAAGLNFADFF